MRQLRQLRQLRHVLGAGLLTAWLMGLGVSWSAETAEATEAADAPQAAGAPEPADRPDRSEAPYAPPPVTPPVVPTLPAPELTPLANGATLWTLSRPTLPMQRLELGFMWPGSAAAPQEQLNAGFAGSLLGGDTETRSAEELAAAMDALGASWDLGMSTSLLWASLDVPTAQLEPALALLMEALTQPRFTRAEARRVRRRWASWKDETWLDIRRVHRRALNHAWFPLGHPSRHSASVAEVKQLTARGAEALVRHVLTQGRPYVVAVGDSPPEALAPLLDAHLAGLGGASEPAQLPPLSPEPALWLVDRPGFSVAELSLLTPGLRRDDPRFPLAAMLVELLAGGFTSRLVSDLRETRGLVYTLNGELEGWRDMGRVRIDMELATEDVPEALEALHAHLDALVAGDVQAEELAFARGALLSDAGRQLETSASAAGWLSDLAQRGQSVEADRAALALIDRAEPAALDALAAELFAAEGRVVVITGDRYALEPLLEQAGRVPDRLVDARVISEER